MIAIVKYNAGNVQSVQYALQRLGVEAIWTDDPVLLQNADKVIFPGVGEASSAMAYIKSRGLDTILCGLQQPVLGICLGLQLFCAHSEENDTACMDVFEGVRVRKFEDGLLDTAGSRLKVPHVGWNTLNQMRGPLFEGIADGSYAYFVHSYYAEQSEDTIATCTYGTAFSAALQHNNFYAVQFHPEKSGKAGERLLHNFLTNL